MSLRYQVEDKFRVKPGALAAALAFAATAMVATASPAAAEDNAVVHWNTVAARAFAPTQGTQPLPQSRTFAILHAAIHDAVNAIQPRYAIYTTGLTAKADASVDAAVAAASRAVLVALVPEQQPLVEEAYAAALAAIPAGPARDAGIAVGIASASATLERRRDDGLERAITPVYAPSGAAGDYQFTPPFDFALFPGWGNITPFAVKMAKHRVRGPHPLASEAYARDFAQVKAIGAKDSSVRTADQTEIAKFWYEDSPLGWNRIASTVIQQARLDVWDAARVFALVNFAMADGFITGFHAKYDFRFWRPITAIRNASGDGNTATIVDAAWEPLLPTPPVPDYPSTHTVLGAAAAEVLIHFFGDKVAYSMTSLTLPGVTRRFQGFSQAALENGQSRIYAGIHFRRAVDDGYTQGQRVGRAVAKLLPPVD